MSETKFQSSESSRHRKVGGRGTEIQLVSGCFWHTVVMPLKWY